MTRTKVDYARVIPLILVGLLLTVSPSAAQEEVASAIRRYKAYEASSGFYEEYEVMPRRAVPMVDIPGVRRGLLPYSSTAAAVRVRTRLSDSHMGIKFYDVLRCQTCHIEQTKDIHTTRANLTCRQCHGGEPISGIDYYYSPMNPIRKHAYICAKCHEGAGASFASYVVHEPPAGYSATRQSFPVLYYTYWFMLLLLTGTLVFFIPHSLLTGIREFFRRREAKKNVDSH